MILACSRPPYAVGSLRHGCTDALGDWHGDQPFVIVREVTYADWFDFCISSGVEESLILANGDERFMEVSID